jgi:hypothetical protein
MILACQNHGAAAVPGWFSGWLPGGAMRISVGIDIAKEVHWITAIDPYGVVQIDRKLLNTPTDIASLTDQLGALGGTVRISLDVVGGIAGLAEAMLAAAGFALVHVPGLAVKSRIAMSGRICRRRNPA